MTPIRLIFVAVATCSLMAFTNDAKTFSVDFPSGWPVHPAEKDGTVQADAPVKGSAFCRANSIALPSLKDVSQATLNAQYGKPLDKATWAGVLSIDPTKVEMSEDSAKVADGHVVQFTTLVIDASIAGVTSKARFSSHILSGRMVNVGCFAPVGGYDGVKAVFEKTVVSLKPL